MTFRTLPCKLFPSVHVLVRKTYASSRCCCAVNVTEGKDKQRCEAMFLTFWTPMTAEYHRCLRLPFMILRATPAKPRLHVFVILRQANASPPDGKSLHLFDGMRALYPCSFIATDPAPATPPYGGGGRLPFVTLSTTPKEPRRSINISLGKQRPAP